MAKKIGTDVLTILSRVTVDKNNILLTCGTLDRASVTSFSLSWSLSPFVPLTFRLRLGTTPQIP